MGCLQMARRLSMAIALLALPGCSLVLDPTGFVGNGSDGGGLDGGGVDGGFDSGVPCMMCGGECVDVTTDPDHCGECPNACERLAGCSAGGCVSGMVGSLSGDTGKDSIRAIAVSRDGLRCVGGLFSSRATWDSGALGTWDDNFSSATSGPSGFVTCSPPGGRDWSAVFLATSVMITDVAVDSERVVVVGSFEGILSVNGVTGEGRTGTNLFVASFSPDGGPPGLRVIGFAGSARVDAVAIVPDMGTCIGGAFDGMISLGGSTRTSDGEDGFVECISSSSSAPPRAQIFSGPGFARVLALAEDTDRLVVAGEFSNTLSQLGFTASGGTDGFVVTIEPDFALGGEQQISGAGEDSARAVVVGADEQVIVGGVCTGALRIGGVEQSCSDGGDAFVLSFGPSDALWGHIITGGGPNSVYTLAVDPRSGDILFGGDYRGAGMFDGEAMLPETAGGDAFVGTLAPNGGLIELVEMAGPDDDRVVASAAGPMGELYFAVDFSGMVGFPGGTLTSLAGTPDSAFVSVPASRR